MRATLIFPIIALLAYPVTDSIAENSFADAITNGRPYLKARYRYEVVNQDGFTKNARASTLLTRVGFETQKFKGFSALLEGENITILGHQNFNDTINGRTQFPVVADPEITELNQAYIDYHGIFDTAIRVGRQRIRLDNQRFVGTVSFRQNEQTFDAVGLTNKSLEDTVARYYYVDNVNRIFGAESQAGDFRSNSHLFNVKYDGFDFGSLTGYAYVLKFDNSAALSSQSYGLRLKGRKKLDAIEGLSLLYAAEFAHQRPHGENPGDFDLNYYMAEPGFWYRGLTVKLGYEVLEGDGASAFQMPLATLHAFNGITDKFLTTPVNGIEDFYTKIKYKIGDIGGLKNITINGGYHALISENASADLGEEWNAKIGFKLTKYLSFSLQHADYNAKTVSTDTQKTWATLQLAL